MVLFGTVFGSVLDRLPSSPREVSAPVKILHFTVEGKRRKEKVHAGTDNFYCAGCAALFSLSSS